MAVRMIKKSWWVDIRFNHRRYRKRSPENSRAGGLAYEAVLRQKLARGEGIDKVDSASMREESFESFAWRWFEEYVMTNNTYLVQRNRKYVLAASIIPFFRKFPVHKITSHDIEQFKASLIKKGLSNKTINDHLGVLGKCLATAYEWMELETASPKVKPLKCPPPRTDYLSAEECQLLLANSEGVIQEMLLTALRTGMRQGEIKGLQWNSIEWGNQNVLVRDSQCDSRQTLTSTKSNRERHIPLDIDVYNMLLRRKEVTGYVFLDADGKPFTHKRLTSQLARVCKKAGLRRITWHRLRHTFASHLAMKGVPLNTVQSLLGHSTISTTMRYAHVAPSTFRSAIDLRSEERRVGKECR